MPFNRPTPTEILHRLEVELNAAFPGADAKLRQSVESVLARMQAMSSHEMYGYIDWIAKQILPDTADAEVLDRHSTLWGVPRKASTAATGAITFTGTTGITIPAGAVLRRADNAEYTLDADVTLAGGTGTGQVSASVAGADGNAVVGAKLNLTSPVAGVQSQTTVAGAGLTGGTDTESDADLRRRIIARIQQPPHGGADHDYVAWALAVAGVTRAWVYPLQYGLGTVGVTFVMDNKAGTIIPSAGEVTDVQDYIDTQRPVTADVTVFAPVAVPVNFQINLSPNTVAVQNAIKAELEDFFRREAKPGGTLYISRIREAISTAAGEFDHVLVAPAANVVMAFGQMPVIGTWTWGAL